VSALDVIRDALARVVWISEGLEFGDVEEARQGLYDLECDLAVWLGANEQRAA
jgi:hypothetical protein